MRFFDLLAVLQAAIVPDRCKVHLATWNGNEDPLDVYFSGEFHAWQQWQSRRNFEREFVVSLIALHESGRWLLAGVYQSLGSRWFEPRQMYSYRLEPLPEIEELAGRVVADFVRPGRQSYLNAENWADRIGLSEIFREKLSIGEFPGYRKVDLSHAELETVVSLALASWRTALSNVAGIYLISDTLGGQLYVGSASGEGGLWRRWSEYAVTGHGGNVVLRKLLREEGADRVRAFRYSILEITDIHASEDDVLARESHWKKILLSRAHGLNAN